MYRGFKLSLDLRTFENHDNEFVQRCKEYGNNLESELTDSFEEILNDVTDENDVISGEDFINTWFPTTNYDVFLSYSHDDEELALMFAGFLKNRFKLNVFIDSLFWGSADELLWKIDKKYCIKDNGDFDYKKRNFTTTHVHAMLATAIAKTIDSSEIVIFLNSGKSTYKVKEEIKKNRTLSPWIYEEIFFTSIIRKKEWYEHRTGTITEGKSQFETSFKISYPLPDDCLISLEYDNLQEWNRLWDDRMRSEKGKYGDWFLAENERLRHPFNVLYDCISIHDVR